MTALAASDKSTRMAMQTPDIKVSARQMFGLDTDMEVPAFSARDEHVLDLDEAYRFYRDTTYAILHGFAFNLRVMI